jgi:hypothetical protein
MSFPPGTRKAKRQRPFKGLCFVLNQATKHFPAADETRIPADEIAAKDGRSIPASQNIAAKALAGGPDEYQDHGWHFRSHLLCLRCR